MAVGPLCAVKQLGEEEVGEFSSRSVRALVPVKHPGRCQDSEEEPELETNI